jgi:flagellar basal-body rod protein FlgG
MKFFRAVFLCGLSAFTVVAIVGGQYVVQRHFENRRLQTFPKPAFPPSADLDFPPLFADIDEFDSLPATIRLTDRPIADDWADDDWADEGNGGGIKYFPRHPELDDVDEVAAIELEKSETANSSAADEANGPELKANIAEGIDRGEADPDSQLASSPQQNDAASQPGKLPAPENASPIRAGHADRDAIRRAIIRQELPHASAEEHQIWYDELKGMPPQMMRDLLRIRNRLNPHTASRISKRRQPTSGPVDEPREPFELLPTDRVAVEPGPIDVADEERGLFHHLQRQAEPTIAAIQLAGQVILNNIANVNTVGFKRSRVLFEDLPYQQLKISGQQDSQGQLTPVGIAVGLGIQVAATQPDHSQGRLLKTDRPLDVAIVGDGFFQIQDGVQILYTRAGTFSLNNEGQIVLTSAERGRLLEPSITVPSDATIIQISAEGVFSVRQAGQLGLTQIGQCGLARFSNPAALESRGENLFAATDASGSPLVGMPGQEGRGKLRQRCLEESNVQLRDELAALKRLQRQLQAISQATNGNGKLIGGSRPTTPRSNSRDSTAKFKTHAVRASRSQ